MNTQILAVTSQDTPLHNLENSLLVIALVTWCALWALYLLIRGFAEGTRKTLLQKNEIQLASNRYSLYLAVSILQYGISPFAPAAFLSGFGFVSQIGLDSQSVREFFVLILLGALFVYLYLIRRFGSRMLSYYLKYIQKASNEAYSKEKDGNAL